jgi:hypothetical protein
MLSNPGDFPHFNLEMAFEISALLMSKTIITNFRENITNCENLSIDNINKL